MGSRSLMSKALFCSSFAMFNIKKMAFWSLMVASVLHLFDHQRTSISIKLCDGGANEGADLLVTG